ncbi:hypothetical protein G7K71_14230 [Desulfofundulus sp. TPOSR]|uniref:chemotaxis protein CheW n=1 Tax=Desulfofundulus sp. TPOSR TaxID=2714340 RepID=UPI00140E182A|nr:chemotaxis protein CheW [Desulfofundulus sp. TPOSR]NHM28116.1 hypothetical protein [Desulfofundulus sp. TPOSR]
MLEQQVVTFHLNTELFGIELKYVQEVIRVPAVVAVPCTPSHFLGLSNLRGEILPVVDGRIRVGTPAGEISESARVVVISRDGGKVGFLVDRVSEVVDLEGAEIEEISSDTRSGCVHRAIRFPGTNKIVLQIDVEKLFSYELKATASSIGAVYERQVETGEREQEELIQLVAFRVGAEEYAVSIGSVQEIVRVPEKIYRAPGLPFYVDGIFSLRERTLPIVNFRKYLGLEFENYDERSRIIVLNFQKDGMYFFGLGVDAVNEVLRVKPEEIEPLPDYFLDREQAVKDVCKLEGGKRLVYVLEADKMVEETVLKELNASEERRETVAAEGQGALHDERQYVVFALKGEEYGVEIGKVQEIIRVPGIVGVPRAPHYIRGVVNIRGSILPVMDLRRKFNLSDVEDLEQCRIVVVELPELKIGLVVDAVKEVVKIAAAEIEPPPAVLAVEVEQEFLAGIAKLRRGERLIMLLDLNRVLTPQEKREVKEILDEEN